MTSRDDHVTQSGNEAFLAALPVPALLLDSRRALMVSNALAEKAFIHIKRGEDIARSIRNPLLLEAVDRVLVSGENSLCEVQMGKTPPLTYEVSIAMIEPDSVLMVFIDLTSARRADVIRSAFVANVSHELRSPLTTLMGAVEALEGPAADDAEGRTRMLALMGQEARRMKNLIDDLLSLSRVETQEFIAPGQNVDLGPLLEGARERLSERATARDMTIHMEISADIPKIPGADDELFQVFDNLIGNAIKYGAPGSTVTVRVTPESEEINITVHNDGTPIPSEHLPRLTERFYRIDKSRSRELGGTGLGLAIVKHIVNRHRGRLLITSSEQAGTSFSVILPVSA